MSIFDAIVRKIGRNISKKYDRPQFSADNMAVSGRNLDFLDEPVFAQAWAQVAAYNHKYWSGKTPDIRWRCHVALWAARHGLTIPGDFVECGVNTGLLSAVIYKVLKFEDQPRTFHLCDTYEGIPSDGPTAGEREMAQRLNKNLYNFDAYAVAKDVFGGYANARLVKGRLPQSLATTQIDKIAYLSIDLNVASAEIETIEVLWDKLSKSAIVVLDDYGFSPYREQYERWNAFAASRGAMILHSPTGQGVIIK